MKMELVQNNLMQVLMEFDIKESKEKTLKYTQRRSGANTDSWNLAVLEHLELEDTTTGQIMHGVLLYTLSDMQTPKAVDEVEMRTVIDLAKIDEKDRLLSEGIIYLFEDEVQAQTLLQHGRYTKTIAEAVEQKARSYRS